MGINYSILAQTEPYPKQTIEDLIEDIASSTDDELDYTTLYDDLNYYLYNPLNLNTATQDELEKLKVLNDFQINSLLDYIDQNGAMVSVYELQLVHGFTFDDIEMILPFVTISDELPERKSSLKNILKYGNNQLFIRGQDVLEEQSGYTTISDSALAENPNSRYLGSSYRFYTRYKFQYKDKVYFGFTAEKDPGEEFFTGSNKNGFDYMSGHLQINNIGIFKTITLGDFEAKYGQGLVLWSDFGMGKSPYVLNTRKRAQGLRKYSSTNENVFMRGAGTTVSFDNLDISAFFSYKNIDANIQDSIDHEIATVTSFQNSGIHATPSQLEDKNAINEKIAGGNITYNHSNFKLGLTGVYYEYGAELIKDTTPENQFNFRGKENTNLSVDYQFSFKDFYFFGEEAISANGAKAFLNSMLVNLAPQVSMSVLHRYYDRDYHANYSNAFAEGSNARNQSGLYFGLEIHPIKHWKITSYFDTYRFLWLKLGVDAPSSGNEWFVQTDYNPTRDFSIYLRLKNEVKQKNKNTESGIDELADESLLKARLHLVYQINKQLAIKNRIETTKYQKGNTSAEYGYMVYQDIFYVLEKLPLSFNARFAVFDTESYNTRIYAYESDILYAFSIPAYYSKGTRFYFNVKYSVAQFIDLWIKYSQTYYSDMDVISSGLNQINGHTKSEVKAQLRIKF
ncbi:MAG: ComEA family DNA-binding protein [Bacteroidota bacterium]